MAIKVILFGQLVDLVGKKELEMESTEDTQCFQQQLHARYPALSGAVYLLAVDKEVVTENTPLPKETTVALLPPYSGG